MNQELQKPSGHGPGRVARPHKPPARCPHRAGPHGGRPAPARRAESVPGTPWASTGSDLRSRPRAAVAHVSRPPPTHPPTHPSYIRSSAGPSVSESVRWLSPRTRDSARRGGPVTVAWVNGPSLSSARVQPGPRPAPLWVVPGRSASSVWCFVQCPDNEICGT